MCGLSLGCYGACMNIGTRTHRVTCAVAAGIAALPALAGAQTTAPERTYVVTTIGASGAGAVVAHETLSLQHSGKRPRLQIAADDGSVLSLPAAYAANGELDSATQDSAVQCYNMAVDTAAQTRLSAPSEPASVFVRFGKSVVQIPLTVRATQVRGSLRDIALDGRSSGVYAAAGTAVAAGIVVTAAIEQDGDDLRSATFDEVHYAGTPPQIIARSSCVLQRAEQRPTTRV